MRILMTLLIFVLSGCAVRTSKLAGRYSSSCYLHLYPRVILKLDRSHTFSYKLAYLDDKIEGSWVVRADTLFLFSDYFNENPVDSMIPRHKLTDQEGMDTYVIKKNKLYMLLLNGMTKDCYLKKVKRGN